MRWLTRLLPCWPSLGAVVLAACSRPVTPAVRHEAVPSAFLTHDGETYSDVWGLTAGPSTTTLEVGLGQVERAHGGSWRPDVFIGRCGTG